MFDSRSPPVEADRSAKPAHRARRPFIGGAAAGFQTTLIFRRLADRGKVGRNFRHVGHGPPMPRWQTSTQALRQNKSGGH
jgi:hypothetical protein